MVTGQQIVDAARQLLGAPYRYWGWGDPIPMWLYDGQGDPPPASHLLSYGVECSDLVNYSLEVNGLPPGYGTEAFYNYLIEYEDFDPYKPQPPGAIAFRPYSGPALSDQGHIAIYTGDGKGGMGTQLIQAITAGVTEYYDAATTYSWGGSTEFWYIAKLPNVDYGSKPQPHKGTPFTVDHLLSVYSDHLTREDAEKYFPYMLAAFKEFDISTRERIAAFLGQASGEVGEFDAWSEINPPAELGNYYGRGPMGVTWEAQYQWITEAWNKAHPEDPQDFHANPDLLATPKYGFWGSSHFWRNGNGDLNYFADRGDFEEIMTRCFGEPITGDSHDFRVSYYQWGLKQLPADLTLADVPTPEEGIVFEKYNFAVAAEDQEALDYAHLAATALSTVSAYDTLVFAEEDNVKALAEAAVGQKATCVVVGKAAHGLLPDDAKKQESGTQGYIWQCYEPKAEKDAVGSLRRMRNMVLPYFAPALVDKFDSLLLALDKGKYAPILEEAKKDGPPPPQPPAPVVNWAGFGKDGVLRMGGDWSDGYIIWPDPTKNNRPYWVEYIADREEKE